MNTITVYPRPDMSEIDTPPMVYKTYDENGVTGYEVDYTPKTGFILVTEELWRNILPEFRPDHRHLQMGDYLFEMRWPVQGNCYLFSLVEK